MSTGIRRPYQAVDYDEVARLYPPPPEYFESAFFLDPELIEKQQLSRLQQRALTAYQVPFFRERWDAAGFDPRSLQTLDDLWRVPFYTVEDIRKSIEAHPPWGTYQGVTPDHQLLIGRDNVCTDLRAFPGDAGAIRLIGSRIDLQDLTINRTEGYAIVVFCFAGRAVFHGQSSTGLQDFTRLTRQIL